MAQNFMYLLQQLLDRKEGPSCPLSRCEARNFCRSAPIHLLCASLSNWASRCVSFRWIKLRRRASSFDMLGNKSITSFNDDISYWIGKISSRPYTN